MRPRPLLARLALRTGAAFRCAERLASSEGLASRLAPDLEAVPLVAEDRLRRLVEPSDGSTALRRTLSREAAPSIPREVGEGAVAEWLPIGRVAAGLAPVSALPARPAPRQTRPAGEEPAALQPPLARIDQLAQTGRAAPASPEAVQAILDRVASSFPQGGELGAKGAAGSRSRVGAGAAPPRRARQIGARAGDPAPLGRAGGGSFLLRRAALTPVLIDEAEAPSGLLAPGSSSSVPSEPPRPSPPRPRASSGSPGEATALAGAPGQGEFLRGSSALPSLSAPPSVGGFRGLAGLAGLGDRAEAGRPEIAMGREAPSPFGPSAQLGSPFESSGSRAGSDLTARPQPLASGLDSLGSEAGAAFRSDLGASGADLEAALDHALRRAARRHGIEVLEP